MDEMEENGFGENGWDAALRQQNAERENAAMQRRAEMMAGIVNGNRAVFDNYGQIMQKDAMERARRARNGAVNLLAAYKYSLMNHNRMPQQMVPGVNDALGFDMNTRAMYSAGVTPNFNMVLGIASRDPQTGQMSNEEKEVSAADIYNMSRENPGILNRDEMMSLRENIIRKNHWTMDMANKYVPELPEGWGEAAVGQRSPTGGIRVPGSWMGTPERRGGAVFSSDGRGGFSNTSIAPDGSVSREGYGTRSPDNKGRWKVLSSGSHGDGRRGTRYENDKTGEVVFVPEGQTIESVTRGVSDKERVAQIQENAKSERAAAQNETRLSVADLTAQLKRQGYDVDEKKLAEAVRHNQAVESQQAENEKGRNERAKQANELKTKMAEMKSRGTIGGRPPTTHEYVEALRFANDLLNDETDRNAMREHAKRIEESLKQRGEKIPEPPSPSGKAEVKTGDNGGGDGRQFKEGDVQEINGIRMKLLPSKKNPGKLTWQRV